MTVLEKIDELRLQRGWSVNNLAMEAMLTQSTLNNLYSRKAEPKLSTLRAICCAFGITLAEFFQDCDEETNVPSRDSTIQQLVANLNDDEKDALILLLKRKL